MATPNPQNDSQTPAAVTLEQRVANQAKALETLTEINRKVCAQNNARGEKIISLEADNAALRQALEKAEAEKQALLALNRFDGKAISELTNALDEIRTHAQGNQSDPAYTLATIDVIAARALKGGAS